MYPSGIRCLIWVCALMYLCQHIYYPVVDYMFGLSYIGSNNFDILQLVTYGFLHGDVYHIVINMIVLIVFGSRIEIVFGARNLLALFLISTILGGVVETCATMYNINKFTGTFFPVYPVDLFEQLMLSLEYGTGYLSEINKVVIGASAGVFGCMIAYTYLFPKARLSLPFLSSFSISARLLVLLYILNEIYFIVYNPIENVAHFAHLGGAIGGLLVSFTWKRTIAKKMEERHNQKLSRNKA